LARKILLADDSVTAQNMGRKILSEAGFEVITVSNGSAALKKAVEQRPDLIVLDVYMPGYGGLEVCQRLKEMRETARMPVLLTVGKLEPFKPDEARRARADAFIIKPFEASELLAAVRKLEDRIIAGPEAPKTGRLSKLLSRNAPAEVPEKDAGITEEGWKDRLSIPARPRAEQADADEAVAAVPPSTQVVDGPSVVQPAPQLEAEHNSADPVVDITPEEIAAIKAAAATLTGALDSQGDTRISEVQAAVPSEAQSPSYEDTKTEPSAEPVAATNAVSSIESQVPEEVKVTPEPAATAADTVDAVLQSIVAEEVSVKAAGPRWVAHEVPLEGGEGDASLAREMEIFLAAMATEETRRAATPGGGNGNVAAVVAENRQEEPVLVASAPEKSTSQLSQGVNDGQQEDNVDGEAEILDDQAETPSTFAVAVISETVHEHSSVSAETATVASESKQVSSETSSEVARVSAVSNVEVAAESAMAMAASASGSVAPSTVEPETVSPASAAGTSPHAEASLAESATVANSSSVQTPAAGTGESSTQDKVRAAEMAAAWSHWQEVRQSIVGSGLADQITDVAAAAARANVTDSEKSLQASATTPESLPASSQESAPLQQAAPTKTDSSSIASIVDSVLAELKPRIVEEIAKKLGEKK
jgi:CheY-like chemotaxis protein